MRDSSCCINAKCNGSVDRRNFCQWRMATLNGKSLFNRMLTSGQHALSIVDSFAHAKWLRLSLFNLAAEHAVHLIPLPALADNYIWLLYDDAGDAVVVDPGEDAPVEQALTARNLRLQAILLTHHHADHVAGAAALRAHHGVPVYAPDDARIESATVRVGDGERVDLAQPRASFEVIAVPGHTLSHVAYFGEGVLLAGDTLFSLGCGRLFEGNPAQMLHSLDRLAALPANTLLCCGHEYTAANGRFALEIEPGNTALSQRMDAVAALRRQQQPSLPVSMASELATNPFLRTDTPAIVTWGRQLIPPPGDRVARFAAVRAAKDAFRA